MTAPTPFDPVYDPATLAGRTILQLRSELQAELALLKAAIPRRLWVDAADPWWNIPWGTDRDVIAPLMALEKKLPDGAKVLLPPGQHVEKIDWILTARKGISYIACNLPFPDAVGAATTFVSGKSESGGTMLSVLSCDHPEFIGIAFQTDRGTREDCALEVDLSGLLGPSGTSTSTAPRFRYCLFRAQNRNPDLVLAKLSDATDQNNEYGEFDHCAFSGGYAITLMTDIQIDPANPLIAISPSGRFDKTWHDRKLFRLAGLAPDPAHPELAPTHETVMHYLDANRAQLDQAVPFAVPAKGRALIDRTEARGVTLAVGSKSANAKMWRFNRCYFNNLDIGYQQGNGSCQFNETSFTGNETDRVILGASEPCTFVKDNMEASRQFLHLVSGMSMEFVAPRIGTGMVAPGQPTIRFERASHVILRAVQVDQSPPAGSKFFDATGAHLKLEIQGIEFPSATTKAQVGFSTIQNYYCVVSAAQNIVDLDAGRVFMVGSLNPSDTGEAIIGLPGVPPSTVFHAVRGPQVLGVAPAPKDAALTPGTAMLVATNGNVMLRVMQADGLIGTVPLGKIGGAP